ncbi:MAG: dTDP-4-dehydrorhamnose 3,5-epimerase [Oscillospiraceae bacterium]|jgi:dTDP-4-dehydrorhamnose 3,5-epimerase
MRKFVFEKTPIGGLFVISPSVFADNRGCFFESYNYLEFQKNGLDLKFVQDNESFSKKGVIRGLHFQKNNPQSKLVRAVSGEIFDVAVDLRKDSPTFKKWFGVILSAENKKQLFIPEGFAHGFSVLSETAIVSYKCSRYYDVSDECGIIFNDSRLAIDWKIPNGISPILSKKDSELLSLTE